MLTKRIKTVVQVKGVVLAGGSGTRFLPVTAAVNKHLLDIYDRPMLFYPIKSLIDAGLDDIFVVTAGDPALYEKAVAAMSSFNNVRITFVPQAAPQGIADALFQTRDFVDGDDVVVLLGDNIFQANLARYIDNFRNQKGGARVLIKQIRNRILGSQYAVASFSEGRLAEIVEKPEDPETDTVVTGCYMYDSAVFEVIETLGPSARGEFEITDVNAWYLERGLLEHDVVDGWWIDAGTPSSKLKAALLIALENDVALND